ncbi:gamma-glutamyl-gamma-aminobutyrate hydrolase family protein [Lichenifustis flavocetrariae]|uniref:Gamma-glutamyl-gamma-aminobutyrate hydrolase family protein n=1 Tax=Lichenifustis flavocetrariae TaxID=2949735 RepID=A0AA41Z313_9HYPH|nr:gamma-glutamyl-gamma-aminobutyrate hydrolase family protein [Lichenifustis flavocetrariae]MCW6511880.1 gamma-glutamyl-gamma-aminobutyrate hydrolase family protein [Lichenifustis flavocetrariae]
MRSPRIAVLLDENTSGGGDRYEAAKGYFVGIADAGGLPFGIPYLPGIVGAVLDDFDGLPTAGGRFAYPEAWYLPGHVSPSPASDRLDVERALVQGFLDRDKPMLGICAGMQMLACIKGCLLTPDLRATMPDALEHDRRGASHAIEIAPGSRLAQVLGRGTLDVNTFHREAVARMAPGVTIGARASDGVVEAIELPGRRFAVGVQWHQERFACTDHAGNALFRGLVEAASEG